MDVLNIFFFIVREVWLPSPKDSPSMWPMAPRSPWDTPTLCHRGNLAGFTPTLMFIQSDILMGGAAVINSKSHVMSLRISTTGGLLNIQIGKNLTYLSRVKFIYSLSDFTAVLKTLGSFYQFFFYICDI